MDSGTVFRFVIVKLSINDHLLRPNAITVNQAQHIHA